jgi:hypothetical protein
MTEPDLTPQEPGAISGVDDSKLAALAEGNVGDLVEALDTLTDLELEQLAVLEQQGKARTTALGAITREQQQRAVAADHPADAEPANDKTPLGDPASYAQMHAHEIDATKLTSPVLTLDGWLLPRPSANPEG